ncbi:MAG: efflux RND transporter permease subunit [Candidatus Aminicenantes bacterium]|nr:MAG: efflux RND transporter permease subunit [Candidatus Aminicenantes bacterium]
MTRNIEWFAKNPVAANLVMLLIIAGGLLTMSGIKQEVFPEIASDLITVSVPYLGAAPEDIEEAVCVRIEEEIQSLEGIKRITSRASEGIGSVTVELIPGTDVQTLLDDIKARIDAIDTFPEETEKPIIQELLNRRQVINLAISGDTDEKTLKVLSEQIRDDILMLPGITQAEIANIRPYEISIEVSEQALHRFDLTFDEVAVAVRRSSLDLPGGSIKTEGGEVLLRTKGQAYAGLDFENIILRTQPDGTRLKVGDVATVMDGFAETDQAARFDGKPSALIQVFRVGNEDAIQVAKAVRQYISEAQQRMPEGIKLTIWSDDSEVLKSRLDLLFRNGRTGFLLVFIMLALFLRLRLAFWVALGIPISFLGAIWLMPTLDVSVNMISLFAFIVVIGIVVDDAIIVGENIFSEYEKGKTSVQAAIDGVKGVAVPVVFAVLTTIAAFWPLLRVEGAIGKIMRFIPVIVISTLLFSLIESLFILPSHLSHLRKIKQTPPRGWKGIWGRFQKKFNELFQKFIERIYRPSLELGIKLRYVTLAGFIAVLLLTMGLVGGGWIKFVFLPRIDADNVIADLTMPLGTPVEATADAVRRLEETALRLQDELDLDRPIIQHVLSSIGEQPSRNQASGPNVATGAFAGSHLGEVNIELVPSEIRNISSVQVANRWRELTGPIPDAVELTFASSLFSAGAPINIQLASSNYPTLRKAAERLKDKLKDYPGVFDVADSFRAGKQEVKLEITPVAESLGLTLSDLGRQVRQAFYGEEVQRIQRGRDEIKVMVRYPSEERRSLANLENKRIRISGGIAVPFSAAAKATLGRGYSTIQRTDRRRTINITADVDENKANANELLTDITRNVLPSLFAEYPGVSYSLEGEQRDQSEALGSLRTGFMLALFFFYALLAIPFRSYLQPVLVMAVIPFGVVGAIWGHIIMGIDLTILSFFGIVALTGVVVNDSLVLVDFINRFRASGEPIKKAIREAGVIRFRPIILTSITTFAGLTPLLLERSLQARFLIPMAVSLAFGVVFATFITLVLVPVSYQILEDIKNSFFRLFRLGKATS